MTQFKTIIIVEDDVFITELYARSLRRAGYEVTTVVTGTEALELGKKGEHDLMLLDILTPELTGIEVLKALRQPDNQAPNMKIIITTNLDQDEVTRADIERLADGYIIKADITPKRLIELIHQLEEFGSIENEPTDS